MALLGCQQPAPKIGDDLGDSDGGAAADRAPGLSNDSMLVDPPGDGGRDAQIIDAAPDAPFVNIWPCGNGLMDPGEVCDDGVQNDDLSGHCSRMCRSLVDWTATQDGPAHLDDEATAIAWDPRGFVLLTGSRGIATDDTDIWVARLGALGALEWERTHGGAANRPDIGQGVAVDPSGNVLVNATEWLDLRTTAIWTRKYDETGDEVWTRSYAPGLDSAGGVATDTLGNVIAVGAVATGFEQKAFVRKYSPGGTILWSREIGGAQGDDNGAQAVTIGPAGAVVVSGYLTQSSGSEIDSWITRLSAAGADVWMHLANTSLLSSATSVAMLGDDVVACGYTGRMTNATDFWVRRIDARGLMVWSKDIVRVGPERCTGIAVDPATGEVVVAVNEDGGAGLGRAVLRKYDSAGVLRWTRAYAGAAGLGARINAVTIGPSSTVLVAGTEHTASHGNDSFVRAYAP